MECTRGAARLCMQAGTRHDRAQRGGLAVSANEAAVQVGIMHYSCRKQDAYLDGVDSIGFLLNLVATCCGMVGPYTLHL